MCDRSPEQGPATAERVGSKDEEDSAGDHFDDTVDARGKELVGITRNAQVGEDLGRVVVDSVCARHLLADHEADGDEDALAVAGDGEHFFKEILNTGASDEHALVLELVGDVFEFFLYVGVAGREMTDAAECSGSFFPAVGFGEETRGFVVQHYAADKEDGGEGL